MNNVKKVNRLFLYVVLATLAAGLLVGVLVLFTDSTVIQLLTNQILLFLPAAVYLIKQPEGVAETIGLKKIPGITIPLLVLEMLLLLPIVSVLNVLSMFIAQNYIGDTVTSIIGEGSLLVAVLIIAFVPAMFEEIIFRGIIYNHGYRKASPVKVLRCICVALNPAKRRRAAPS